MHRYFLAALALAPCAAQIPPVGPIQGIRPLSMPSYSLRHCSYVGSFCQTEDENPDFQFILTKGVSGAPNSYSFQSAGYPSYFLGIKNASSGAVGIIQPPGDGSLADATWALAPPLAPAPPGTPSVFSLVSLSKLTQWEGKYLVFAESQTTPCVYPEPSGDALLTAAPSAKDRATFMLGAAPPQPPAAITVDASTVTNPAVNKRFMGCGEGRRWVPRGGLAVFVGLTIFLVPPPPKQLPP